ncbi:MAG: hypothetical protein VYE64_01890 [Planctomycetota bacterium]|nr:hypothetical protein [Planctomycetota bacterium]
MKRNWLIVVALMAGMTAGCKPAETTTGETGDAKAPGTRTMIKIPENYTGEFNPNGLSVAVAEGSLAPEIKGDDLDGNAFKLSDYRGKVVMLDFWGDW